MLTSSLDASPFAILSKILHIQPEPSLHGVHCPQLSSSKNFNKFNTILVISSLSENTTTAPDPMKHPYLSKVPKSSGISAISAGKIPPDAPPGK